MSHKVVDPVPLALYSHKAYKEESRTGWVAVCQMMIPAQVKVYVEGCQSYIEVTSCQVYVRSVELQMRFLKRMQEAKMSV